ncbi:protein of unknown function [Xenorhabdus bovienii]|uniref:Uncharacterized protein n=1 Tax=Xenorhabdus bovienii TaxID=40576 RepID=A0A0B6XFZ3_XENBV|nr:protein of unknown function [Xenorhabdus bovienii]
MKKAFLTYCYRNIFALTQVRRVRPVYTHGCTPHFGITTSFQILDLNGWLVLTTNLALYGNQPTGDIDKLPEWRAFKMNESLEEKFKKNT